MTERTDQARWEAPLRPLAGLAVNLSVITALLVYFGWRRTETQARLLGIDESILGLSTQDFLLRSIGPLFIPVAVTAAGALAWLTLHHLLLRRITSGRVGGLRAGARALLAAWLVVPAIAVVIGLVAPSIAIIAFPMSFAVGLLLTYYGVLLGRLLRAESKTQEVAVWQSPLERALVVILVLVSVFWTVSNYAELLGANLARDLQAQLPQLTEVVVYSPQRLSIDAPGASEEPLDRSGDTGDDAAYRYRTVGLRLLDHTGSHYFLVSDGWTPRYGVVVMLADDDPVRLEFVRDRDGNRD